MTAAYSPPGYCENIAFGATPQFKPLLARFEQVLRVPSQHCYRSNMFTHQQTLTGDIQGVRIHVLLMYMPTV